MKTFYLLGCRLDEWITRQISFLFGSRLTEDIKSFSNKSTSNGPVYYNGMIAENTNGGARMRAMKSPTELGIYNAFEPLTYKEYSQQNKKLVLYSSSHD